MLKSIEGSNQDSGAHFGLVQAAPQQQFHEPQHQMHGLQHQQQQQHQQAFTILVHEGLRTTYFPPFPI